MWTGDGQATMYINTYKSTQDGHEAWLYLLLLFDGSDSKEEHARRACTLIDKSHFEKPSRNFTLEDYCNQHIHANNVLTESRQGRTEMEKVSTFLDHISPNLSHIKSVILSDDKMKRNLQQATEKFKSIYAQMKPGRQWQQPSSQGAYRNIGTQFTGCGG